MWTLSRLRARLEAAGIRPSRGLGQNFMVDQNFVQYLLREAAIASDQWILEVGPGPGTLTPHLAQAARHVLAVEIDTRLAEICREETAGCGNVELLLGDALDGKHAINPEVLQRLAATPAGTRPRLIANLPYSVATPLVLNLLEARPDFGDCLVTVQKELAVRWGAGPGDELYGAVSVHLQLLAEVETVRWVPPAVFWPAPHVQSALVRLRPRGLPMAEELRRTLHWVRTAFEQRRKRLARTLASDPALSVAEAEVQRRLERRGLRRDLRPEDLSPADFVAISRPQSADPGAGQ